MKYKLICVDMDGTLLNNKGEISDKNIEILRKVIDKGIRVAISTGRIFTSADFYANLIGVKVPVIAANGAIIIEKDENRVVYKNIISEELVRTLIQLGEENGVRPHFYTADKVLVHSSLPDKIKSDIDKHYNRDSFEGKVVEIEEYNEWKEMIQANKDKIIKCTFIDFNNERIDKIIDFMNKEEKLNSSYGRCNKGELGEMTIIETTNGDVNKGSGVKILSDFYEIDKEEIICIGDGDNDLSMVEYAGLGIAMGNGTEKVKLLSKYITDTNVNDGVAKAIEKFAL